MENSIKSKSCEKIQCECGQIIARGNIAKHKRGKIHSEILKNKEIKKSDEQYINIINEIKILGEQILLIRNELNNKII